MHAGLDYVLILSSPRRVKEDTQYRHRRHQNLLFVQTN